MKFFECLLLVTAFLCCRSSGSTIMIPSDAISIQGGIDLAMNGDTVLVAEGLYYENIDFKGKAIVVTSYYLLDGDSSHISKTIINGSQPSHPDTGSVARFISGEDTTSVICGFTLTGGSGTKVYIGHDVNGWSYLGGGVLAVESGAKIISNKIINNSIDKRNVIIGGGGICALVVYEPKLTIVRNNKIESNAVTGSMPAGGGIWMVDIALNLNINYLIEDNIISNNIVKCRDMWKGMGGGIMCNHQLPTSGMMTIRNNNIIGNKMLGDHNYGAGIYLVYVELTETVIDKDPNPKIYNNIIANNQSSKMAAGISIWRMGTLNGIVPSPGTEIAPQPVIMNNTIVNNIAEDGVAMNIMNATPLLMNNILWNEAVADGGGEIYVADIRSPSGRFWENKYGDIKIFYSDVKGGWEGEGNIDSDPLFADTIDFYLSEQSPCIDAGNDSSIFNDVEVGGMAISPAMGTMRNDMGAYGGNPDSIYKYVTDVSDDSKQNIYIPVKYLLNQNYPNPFNPSTTIEFTLPHSEYTMLKIYNILGAEVATLVSDKLQAGMHKYTFDGSRLASGVYYYQVTAGEFRNAKKMILLR